MPHDRRSRRVLLAMLGLVGMTISVGCLRSSNLRSSAGPLPELSPAGELHPLAGGSTTAGANPPSTTPAPNPGGSAAGPSQVAPAADRALTPASTSNPVVPAGASPAAGGTEAVNDPASASGSSQAPAPAGEAPGPSESPTPLLDAEIRRARAITRQHFESLSAVEASPPVTAPVERAGRPARERDDRRAGAGRSRPGPDRAAAAAGRLDPDRDRAGARGLGREDHAPHPDARRPVPARIGRARSRRATADRHRRQPGSVADSPARGEPRHSRRQPLDPNAGRREAGRDRRTSGPAAAGPRGTFLVRRGRSRTNARPWRSRRCGSAPGSKGSARVEPVESRRAAARPVPAGLLRDGRPGIPAPGRGLRLAARRTHRAPLRYSMGRSSGSRRRGPPRTSAPAVAATTTSATWSSCPGPYNPAPTACG